MARLARIWNTLRFSRLQRELDEELQHHLDLSARDLQASGLSERAARLEASRRLGNLTSTTERTRDMDIATALETVGKDIQYAFRQFIRNPAFTAVAVASLALGIGANTAVFSVFNVVLLKSLPVKNPEQLIMLTDPEASGASVGSSNGDRFLMSYPEYVRLRDRSTTPKGPLSGMCASGSGLNHWSLRIAEGPQEPALGRLVTEDYFSVLGVGPTLGRVFTQADAAGLNSDPYAVISYDYWQQRFAGRANVVGTHIRLYNAPLTIIGVTRPGFRGETGGEKPDLWVPMMMEPLVKPGRDWLHEDTSKSIDKVLWLHVFGRLKPGVTVAGVEAQLNTIFQAMLQDDYPHSLAPQVRKELLDQHIKVRPAQNGAFSGRTLFSEEIMVLLVIAGLVLAIACANVANLLLARATARSKEIGVRLSLGAARGRLFQQFITESLLLSCLGGVAGVALSFAFRKLLLITLVSQQSDLELTVPFDRTVFLFTTALTTLTGLLFGLVPAFRATRIDIIESAKESGRGTTGSLKRMTFAKSLVAVQVAISLLLVAGAGLFLRTLWNLQSVNVGFSKQHLLLFRVDAVTAGYGAAARPTIYNSIAARIRSLPGVLNVAYSENGLFGGTESRDPVKVEGYSTHTKEDPSARFDQLGPHYFSALGVPLLLGREIDEQDTSASPRVCVINEAFATHFFAGRNPIGRHITDTYGGGNLTMQVIGVARDLRDHSLRAQILPRFYVPITQNDGGVPESVYFEVRTATDPAAMLNTVRKAILQVNPEMPIVLSRTVDELITSMNNQPRTIALLCSIFGGIALLLASTGLYGVLSYRVSRRTNEIGIRMAVGADQRNIIRLIFRETGLVIATGMIVGVAATLASTRLIASRLYGLSPADPATLLIALIILALVAVMASYIPALRAARVNPVVALRHE